MNGSNLTTYGNMGHPPDYTGVRNPDTAIASDAYRENKELRAPTYEPEYEEPGDIPRPPLD